MLTDPSDSWPGPNCPDFNQDPPLHDGIRASFTLWKIFLAFETRYFLPLFSDETSSGTNMVGGVILFFTKQKNMVGHLKQCFVVNFSFRALSGFSTIYVLVFFF